MFGSQFTPPVGAEEGGSSKHYVVEPGGCQADGVRTQSSTRHPGRVAAVHKLHYEFEGWLGDELLESTPCFIVFGAHGSAK